MNLQRILAGDES